MQSLSSVSLRTGIGIRFLFDKPSHPSRPVSRSGKRRRVISRGTGAAVPTILLLGFIVAFGPAPAAAQSGGIAPSIMEMVAFGLRDALTHAGSMNLAGKADAFVAGIKANQVVGSGGSSGIDGMSSDSSRMQFALKGSFRKLLEDRGLLAEGFELGARYNGEDARKGVGADIAAGFSYASSGLEVRGRGSPLLAHEEDDFGEWGRGLRLVYDPRVKGRRAGVEYSVILRVAPAFTPDNSRKGIGAHFMLSSLEKLRDRWPVVTVVIFVAGLVYGLHLKRSRIKALFETRGGRLKRNGSLFPFLDPKHGIVRFQGRESECKKLSQWAFSLVSFDKKESEVSIALIIGGQGCGKSRLAHRLCELAEEKPDSGTWAARLWKVAKRICSGGGWNHRTWTAEFLGKSLDGKDLKPETLTRLVLHKLGWKKKNDFEILMSIPGPMLLVIDDAEERVQQLQTLVRIACRKNLRKEPVRILLIARTQDDDSGWWRDLEESFKNFSRNPLKGVVKVALGPVKPKDYRKEYKHAEEEFRKEFKKKGQTKKSEDVSGREMGILAIHIKALLAAYTGVKQDGKKKEEELLKHLIKIEREKNWNREIGKKSPELQGQGIELAIAWLAVTAETNSGDKAKADELLNLIPTILQDEGKIKVDQEGFRLNKILRDGVVATVEKLYPLKSKSRWWSGVHPDILTVWLAGSLSKMIKKRSEHIVSGLLESQNNDALYNLLRHLALRANRYRQLEDEKALKAMLEAAGGQGIAVVPKLRLGEDGDPIHRIAADVLSKEKNEDIANEVSKHIGTGSIWLRELAIEARKILRDKAPCKGEKRAEHADKLSELLSKFSDAPKNDYAEAYTASKEAVRIYRDLQKDQPGAFSRRLAKGLANQSVALWHQKDKKAIQVGKEAVALYRKLDMLEGKQLDGCRFELELARCLNNQSRHLSDLGKRPGALNLALKASEDAEKILKKLSGISRDEILPELADSYDLQGIAKSGKREHKEALVASEKAVKAYRELVRDHQIEEFRPGLARFLNNLSHDQLRSWRLSEALDSSKEAVSINRELAQLRLNSQRGRFESNLAASLHTLSDCQINLGQRWRARKAIDEVVQIRCELIKRSGDSRPDDLFKLAKVLSKQSYCWSRLGKREDALKFINKAVMTDLKALTQINEACKGLARSLSNVLCDVMADHKAPAQRDESCEGLAKSLSHAIRDVRTHLKKLAQSGDEWACAGLAKSLSNQSDRLSDLGQYEEAHRSGALAECLLRYLVKKEEGKKKFLLYLAKCRRNQSVALSGLGNYEKAFQAISYAVRRYDELKEDSRGTRFLPDLVMSLNHQSSCLSALTRYEKALDASNKAEDIYEKLVKALPAKTHLKKSLRFEFLPHLAMSHNNRSVAWFGLKNYEEALNASNEAVRIYHDLPSFLRKMLRLELAKILDNRSLALYYCRKYPEARQAGEDAIEIYRGLEKLHMRDAFRREMEKRREESEKNLENFRAEREAKLS